MKAPRKRSTYLFKAALGYVFLGRLLWELGTGIMNLRFNTQDFNK